MEGNTAELPTTARNVRVPGKAEPSEEDRAAVHHAAIGISLSHGPGTQWV